MISLTWNPGSADDDYDTEIEVTLVWDADFDLNGVQGWVPMSGKGISVDAFAEAVDLLTSHPATDPRQVDVIMNRIYREHP